jgi:hypothetical protein
MEVPEVIHPLSTEYLLKYGKNRFESGTPL